MDAKKTMRKLKGEAEKSNVTLYLTNSTFAEFKKAIHPVLPSKVIDELIREFMDDLKAVTPRARKVAKKK
jgi:hypothetical protein